MRNMKQLIGSPSFLLAVVAGFFLCYMLKSYSNKQSMILSGFQQGSGAQHAAPLSSPASSIMGSSLPSTPTENAEQSVVGAVSASPTIGSSKMHEEINALLPNGEEPKVNLLNPDQIIGMKGQVKRNQTFDLRGSIPVPKQMIPFNNPIAVADDVYTRGVTTLS